MTAATTVSPRHTITTAATTPPQPTPSMTAVRNSFHNAANSRFGTNGPSVKLCSVRLSACMLTLSARASTIGNEQREHDHFLQQVLEAAGDERRHQAAGDVARAARESDP